MFALILEAWITGFITQTLRIGFRIQVQLNVKINECTVHLKTESAYSKSLRAESEMIINWQLGFQMKCTQDGQKFKNFLWFFKFKLTSNFSVILCGLEKVKTINYHLFGRKNIDFGCMSFYKIAKFDKNYQSNYP